MTLTSDTLPLPFPGWEHEPTPAMHTGQQVMFQCAWCGTVAIVAATHLRRTQLGHTIRSLSGRPCPGCGKEQAWMVQDDPTGSDSIAGWHKCEVEA